MTTTVRASDYRAHLRQWHDRVRRGEDIVVTDNGEPSVRVTAAGAESVLERLERDGLLRRARGRRRSDEIESVSAAGDSAEAVTAGRDR